MEIYNGMVQGVPLIFVVMGLVVFFKKAGLKGLWLLIVSLFIGIAFGIGYMIYVNGVPTGYNAYFGYGFYGLSLGLVASGIYDVAKDILTRGLELVMKRPVVGGPSEGSNP
jgi:hypothetical protein